jgi:hypothetical protein
MKAVARFFAMLGALMGLGVCLIQLLVLATTVPQITMACIGIVLSIVIGLLATSEDF